MSEGRCPARSSPREHRHGRQQVFRTLTRVGVVCFFPPSGLDKIYNRRQALNQAGSGRLLDAGLLIDLGIAVELIAPVLTVAEKRDREAALVLAGFCAATAVLFHRFWEYNDLLKRDQNSEGREHLWEFLNNFGLAGGLMTVSLDRGAPAVAVRPQEIPPAKVRARPSPVVAVRPSYTSFR